MDTQIKEHGFEITLDNEIEISDLEKFQDSVWYEGHVFTVRDPRTDYEVSIHALGEVKIIDHRKQYDGNVYRNGLSLFEDGDVKSDTHLSQLVSKQLLEFDNNNWFECVGKATDEFDGYFECVTGTPKEALNCAVGHLLEVRTEVTSFDDTELWEE
jgi:hypothetical protein